MTVLDPSGRPWDVTPKRYITTTAHRVKHDPALNRTIEQAQLGQSRVYDRVLEHFDRHTALPFQAPAGNRELNRARIGHLDRRVERRAVRTGTDTVVVHPGNTSITCTKCGHKDRKSRTGPVFECTRCGYRTDADWNAAINVKRRGHNIFSAWKATRERGRAGCSSRREAGGEAGPGQREQAARGAPVDIVPRACLSLSTCRTGSPVMIWYLSIGSAAGYNSLTLGTG